MWLCADAAIAASLKTNPRCLCSELQAQPLGSLRAESRPLEAVLKLRGCCFNMLGSKKVQISQAHRINQPMVCDVADVRVAQMVEQRTFNPRAEGSIPSANTTAHSRGALFIKSVFLADYEEITGSYMLVWLNGRAADL